jgi:hypothetical protein
MVRHRLVRLGLAYLTVGAALVGVWALGAPRSFFDEFPGGPFAAWAGALPPYNEHLVRDVGALYLGFAVLFAWATWRPVAALIVPVCFAWVVVQLPHVGFHLAHSDALSTGDAVAQAISLAGFVVVATAVAVAANRR